MDPIHEARSCVAAAAIALAGTTACGGATEGAGNRPGLPDAATIVAVASCPDPASEGSHAAPADGRCGTAPRMLMSASSIPTPTDAGPVTVGFGTVTASPAGLYVTTYASSDAPSGLLVGGGAMLVPFDGGQPTPILSGYLVRRPLLTATAAIFDANAVPSGNGDILFSVPFSGGPTTTIATVSDGPIVNGFATDGTYLYFSTVRGIQAVAIQNGGNPNFITLSNAFPVDILGAYGPRLIVGLAQGQLESLPLPPAPNGFVTTLGTGPAGPTDMAPCGPMACWLGGTNTIEGIDPAGGAPRSLVELAGEVTDAYDVSFGGSYAYVIGSDPNRTQDALERVTFYDNCPLVFARMPPSDHGSVSVDDECVYWANSEGVFSLSLTSVDTFQQ